jgi:hypothetical protein
VIEDRLAAILHDAAGEVPPYPRPERVVARARRRAIATASGLLVGVGAVGALSVVWVGGLDRSPVVRPAGDRPVVGEERDAPAPSPPGISEGPRYVVASGTFGSDWGEYAGKEWRYLAWGDRDVGCAQFQVGPETTRNGGVACSGWAGEDPALDGDILDRTYDPGGHGVESIAFGTVSLRVAAVEFRLTSGEVVRVDSLPPPPGLEVPVRYYVAFLPYSANGEMVVLDAAGDVLEKATLCHGSC